MSAPCAGRWCRSRPLSPTSGRSSWFRRSFEFDDAVAGLDRLAQAAAFLALLEMTKRGEVDPQQEDVFEPIRVAAAGAAAREARAIA